MYNPLGKENKTSNLYIANNDLQPSTTAFDLWILFSL